MIKQLSHPSDDLIPGIGRTSRTGGRQQRKVFDVMSVMSNMRATV